MSFKVIALAIVIGTAVGPLTTLGDVSTANLTDTTYWLDLASSAIRSFSSVAVAGLGLLAGMYGIPMLRGKSQA